MKRLQYHRGDTIDNEDNRTDLKKFTKVKKEKFQRVSIFKRIWKHFQEYTFNTSIHGLKYIGEEKRPLFERLWWCAVFFLSIVICGLLIHKVWYKWNVSPVIVSFAETSTPIWQVPFPAVTICSESKSRQTVFNFTKAFHDLQDENITSDDLRKFSDVSLVCDNHIYQNGSETTNQSTVDFLQEVAPQFDEMIWLCNMNNENTECGHLFSPILTEEGLCYTFNMLDSNEIFTSAVSGSAHYLKHGRVAEGWSLDGGYKIDTPRHTYPVRANGAGHRAGLVVLMRAYEYDLDYLCKGPVAGFKILLHHPAETPRVSQQYFRAPLNQEVVVAVRPDMMTTSEGLRGYPSSRRQCYFPKERQLLFYKVYTQQNCQVECLANYTLDICGCVPFYMPRDDSTPICGSGSTRCVVNAEDQLLAREIDSEIKKIRKEEEKQIIHHFFGSNKESKPRIQDCDCLPACTKLQYNAETSQADFNWPALFLAWKANFSELPGVLMTRVTIFFKDTQFITSRRSELYGLTDFLANCGGLLGLFMGFSFLSLVEIFYFLSVRIFCNQQNKQKIDWLSSNGKVNDKIEKI